MRYIWFKMLTAVQITYIYEFQKQNNETENDTYKLVISIK